MKKIKEIILKWLGIDTILVRLRRFDLVFKTYDRNFRLNEHELRSVNEDYSNLRKHLEFLNSNFFAAVDVASSVHDFSSVVIIRKRASGKDDVVFYELQTRDIEHVMSIMQGFGRKNTVIGTSVVKSKPPKFRF